jgi:hypothetical protein
MYVENIRLIGATSAAHLREWFWSLLLLPLCVYFCLAKGEYTMMDDAALILHEAGHFVFGFISRDLLLIGGTLMQIFLPSLLAWNFYRHDYRLGMQVMLLWLGHNFTNISVYAADARARQLPLLGGEKVQHDWYLILSKYGWLDYDIAIGQVFFTLAVLCFAAVTLAPFIIRYQPYR